ncbi:hypothetical protein [Pseudomonas helleri]|uniref:hypothetical protein n=1 Tax=Pseudomonas helleri TaxID=1608996 RepID=UPI003FD48712
MKDFRIEDYLNDDAEIQALLNIVINEGTPEGFIECIRATARLQSIELNLDSNFDSIRKALNSVGYKLVVIRSDI